MAKALETMLCLDSFNRDYTAYREPNDFVLDLKGRYEVQFAAIGSIELPLSQYTIEEDWNTFGFDVGSSLGAEACRTLSLQFTNANGHVVVDTAVVLPTPWLEVVSEGGGGVWRAARPHGLSDAALQRVVGFGATIMQPTTILEPQAVVSIIDATTVFAPGAVAAPGSYGVLLVQNAGTRSFATPAQLAAVLTVNFSAFGWPLRVDWDQQTARATLTTTSSDGGGIISNVGPTALLLRALGFVCQNGPLPIGPPRCEDQGGNTRSLIKIPCQTPLATPVSENFPIGPRIKVSLDPGHYDPSNFRSTVESLVNPLSICGSVPASMFAVEVWGAAAPVPIAVPATRSFHPRGIALAITGFLSAAGLSLVLSFTDDHFVFSSPTDLFIIMWGGAPADIDLATRLGFDPAYTTPLARQAEGAQRNFQDVPTSVLLPVVYDGVSINLKRKFVLIPRARVQRDITAPPIIVTSDGVNTLTVPVGTVPLEYMVLVNGNLFAVAEQVAGDVTLLRPLSTAAFLPVGIYPGVVVPVLGGEVNLYFILPPRACFSRLAEIFGFPLGTSSGDSSGIMAPNCWNFEQPPYVLLELGLQHMSAHINHRCREDSKVGLIGKIPLFPPFKIERNYPLFKSSTGVSYITQLHILLLNPWHQPVHFHGREWSMSLIISSSQRPVHTECP